VGGEFAAGVTLVAEVMPARARPHALGLLQAVSAIGNVIGSLVGFVLLPMTISLGLLALGSIVLVFGALNVLYVSLGVQYPFRWAAITVAMVYVVGLAVIPFAPETKDQPLPE